MNPHQVEIHLLGEPQITVDGAPLRIERRKGVSLIAYLAVEGTPVLRTTLAMLLWPDADSGDLRTRLRQVLSSINKTPLSQWIAADREYVSLQQDKNLWIDVLQFQELLEQPATIDYLSAAVDLYRGEFLQGFILNTNAQYDHWQITKSQALHYQFNKAMERLIELTIEQEELKRALGYCRRWTEIDKINEAAHMQYVRLCAAAGQPNMALYHYHRFANDLYTELGIEPSVEFESLLRKIEAGRRVMLSGEQQSLYMSVPAMPKLSIGRDDVLNELVRRLINPEARQPSQVIIQGWPGVGKSTLAAMLTHHPQIRAFFNDGILFTSLGKQPNLLTNLSQWAIAANIEGIDTITDIVALQRQLRGVLDEKCILFVIDDVWQAEHAAVFNLGGQESSYVYTTRLNDVANAISVRSSDIHTLPVLDDQDALHLLHTLAPDIVDNNPHKAEELVKSLEGLPLAIQVAGRLLNEEMRIGWDINNLLADLRDGSALLHVNAPLDRIDSAENLPTVQRLLQRSTDLLTEETRTRFILLGVFAPKPATFDLDAIQAVWEVHDPKPTVRELVSRGLLEPTAGQRFQMHSLIAAHARSLV